MTANSTGKLQDFFQRLADAYRQALRRTAVNECWLNVEGQPLRLSFTGSSLPARLCPALAHLDSTAGDTPTSTFYGWDHASTHINRPPPPFTPADYTRYGQRALADDGVIAVMHAPTVPMLFAYNRATCEGYFWTADAAELSIYERAAPLQTLFYWALRPIGWHIIHAAAVGTEKGGVLLVGNSGAGKSTTALATLHHHGLKFLCDDKCLVRLKPEPQAFAIFSSAKLKADMLPRLPHLQPLITDWDDDYKAGKSLLYLHPAFADRMTASFPVKALFIPRIGKNDSPRLSPANPAEAFRVLGPSTVIWLPGAEADSYRFMAQLTRQLPCYWLDLSPRIEKNIELISEFLR